MYINGKRQNESFARLSESCATCNLPKAIKIPPGHFFMMGDNRGRQRRQPLLGAVPKKWIIGQAFVTYWPPGRIGLL